MTSRFYLIYLSIAPLVYGLSWYISHRIYLRFLRFSSGDIQTGADDRSLIYAGVFTGLYLAALVVIRDLYGVRRNPQ